MITYIQDLCCQNYDMKEASGNYGINRYNVGIELNKTKKLMKTMKRIY